jgi:hypothetical protein
MTNSLNPNLKKKMEQARAEIDERINTPEGYIEYKPSTRGKIGAPEVMFIRNFSPEDLIFLALAHREDIPIKLIKVLDTLIWNPNNDSKLSVKNWHEKEVVELLLEIYEKFYTTIFANQKWVLTDENWEHMAKAHGGKNSDEYRLLQISYKNGNWKPVFDIDLTKINYYEVPDDVKIQAHIEKELPDGKKFTATFSLPRFGDSVTLKYFMDLIYKDQDAKFARIDEIIKIKNEILSKVKKGEFIDITRLPAIPKDDLQLYNEYKDEKTMFAITASKAMYITEFDGQDVSNLPLEKKIEFARDPRLDAATFKMVQAKFNELKFGIKEELTVIDPIMNKVISRKHSFRIPHVLTAIRTTGTAKTNITFV